MIRGTALACLVSLAPALLASVPAGAQTAAPKRGGVLEFAVDTEPGNLDCHANITFALMHTMAPHYSTLLKFDGVDYPQVKGDLAESWSVSADRLTYTFKLRPNVLFHDGSKLTSADVKASYERIAHPPQGVNSVRVADYSAIAAIETPDAATVVFRLRWPDASMLGNFASPWNCIYSAAKLKEDQQFPKTQILGTGAFTFVEYVKGDHWSGKRFDKYFLPDRPYLDGYRADFITGAKLIEALQKGTVMATFRSVTPGERDRLADSMGDRISFGETPWVDLMTIDFNTTRKPFDDARVRRALSLAVDRWKAAESLSGTTYMKFVGGVMRPGSAMAISESDLAALPGFSHDSEAARAEARRLLAEAGAKDLKFTLINRDIPMPYDAAGAYLIAAWKAIGVSVTQERLGSVQMLERMEGHKYEVGLDIVGDYMDDPTLQLAKYVSTDLSPSNFTGSTDRFLDSLYIGQAVTPDLRQRNKIVREFERHAVSEANMVPFLWWNRITAISPQVKGWHLMPSHFIGQDLTEVWLERK